MINIFLLLDSGVGKWAIGMLLFLPVISIIGIIIHLIGDKFDKQDAKMRERIEEQRIKSLYDKYDDSEIEPPDIP